MYKRAVIYARVSRAYKEDDDRITIEAQMSDCEAYCAKHGYSVVERYVDKDKYRARGKLVNPSGTRKDRPGYTAMLRAALADEFDVIVAWKEDRLYRGAYAALPLSEALDENRALNVELVMESFDHKMLGIKAAIAKIEIDNIRDRMVMGRRVRIERGEIPGGPTRYGYDKGKDKRPVVNPAEAEVVKMVYGWYIEGLNNMEIRRRLNAMSIPPRNCKIWSKATIQNILTFEGYATGEYTTNLDGETYTIHCEPLISLGVWDKSRQVREKNKKHRSRNVKEDYLCRSLIVCPCGWSWGARTSRGKRQQGKSGYYACSRRGHQPEYIHSDCPGSIGAKKTDEFVWDFIVNICDNPEVVHEAIDKKIALLEAERGNLEAEADQLQNQLDKLAEERQWVIAMARAKKITEEDMELQLGAMEFQALDLRKKREEKISTLLVQRKGEYLKEWVEDYLSDVANGVRALEADIDQFTQEERESLYEDLDAIRFEERFNGNTSVALQWAIFEEKRRIVRMLVDKVLVVKDEAGEKKIIPLLAFDIPAEFASLVYDHQSLEYIKSWHKERDEVGTRI